MQPEQNLQKQLEEQQKQQLRLQTIYHELQQENPVTVEEVKEPEESETVQMASNEAMSSRPTIQPHWISKATDICSDGNKVYIVRSDLKCYMVTSDLNEGTDIAVHALHPACQGGDHYFANPDGFYIIKGDSVCFVQNLTTNENASVFELHPNYRGGTHYASSVRFKMRRFIIIWADKGKAKIVHNLDRDGEGKDVLLAGNSKSRLFYWGEKRACFMKPVDQWGVLYFSKQTLGWHKGTKDAHNLVPVSDKIIPFLPGGLTITQGASYGRWELIQSFKNGSDTTLYWEKTIKHHVGYKKSELESIERHWDVKESASCGLTASIAKLHFSTEASYGRTERHTSQEEWTDSTEESKAMSCDIKPGKTVYIWQYQLGFGNRPVLFARNIASTFSSDPPRDNPFNTGE